MVMMMMMWMTMMPMMEGAQGGWRTSVALVRARFQRACQHQSGSASELSNTMCANHDDHDEHDEDDEDDDDGDLDAYEVHRNWWD